MKKIIIGVVVCLAVVFVGMRVAIAVGGSPVKMSDDNLTVVTAPDQEEAQINEAFTVEEYVPPVMEGTNVAIGATVTASGFNDVYEAALCNDGARDTYWEGAPDVSENTVTLELAESHNIHTVVLALNPAVIWAKRTQTLSISISDDGENFTDIVASADYQFDPKTGNQVVIDFDEVSAKYVRVSVTKNTGAVGGQIAEFEVYSND